MYEYAKAMWEGGWRGNVYLFICDLINATICICRVPAANVPGSTAS